jgi:hypothetical protein
MATPENARPKRAPVVVVRAPAAVGVGLLSMLPAALVSVLVHGALIAGIFFLIPGPTKAENKVQLEDDKKTQDKQEEETVVRQEEKAPPESKEPLAIEDVDPAANDFDIKINYNNERIEEFSVPGINNPDEPIGLLGGTKDASPFNVPAPPGIGGGQGGYAEGATFDASGFDSAGMAGGISLKNVPLAGSFYGRSGSTREKVLREGGGTKESEAAVALGLKWLVRNQLSDGRWQLDGDFPDQGGSNDIAATAFGLLPLLGAGYTHLKAKNSTDNPFDKPIEKALWYLMSKQSKKTGAFSTTPDPKDNNVNMYAHGLATIAMCEAYGLSQDPALRKSAQMAVNYILYAQHEAGGWRYHAKQAGDLSVAGWQIMALKSAKMAGLNVPEKAFRDAQKFVDACNESKAIDTKRGDTEGYGYIGPGATPTMSAVGLLCRQYLQAWGPQNDRMDKGVKTNIMRTLPPEKGPPRNMYYYYYATQVMHHFGGESWTKWNEKMRESLVKSQDKTSGKLQGSWDSRGDPHSGAGGRLMYTSLALLTLEVYYRHLPLYYREAGDQPQRLLASP